MLVLHLVGMPVMLADLSVSDFRNVFTMVRSMLSIVTTVVTTGRMGRSTEVVLVVTWDVVVWMRPVVVWVMCVFAEVVVSMLCMVSEGVRWRC